MSAQTFERLCEAPIPTLETLFEFGRAPRRDRLAGWEFRCYHRHALTVFLRLRKFKLGFRLDERDPELLRGYTVRVEQNGRYRPWIPRGGEAAKPRFGCFEALPARPTDGERHSNSLLLDFGRGRPAVDPGRLLRSYLVTVNSGDCDVLLGRCYVGPGGDKRFAAGFFVLEQYNRIG